MPQIIVKGITEEQCAALSVKAAPQLAEICDCPSDWFVFDLVPSKFFTENGAVPHYPVVQVWWFSRPAEIQNKVAQLLHSIFTEMGFADNQISFHLFKECDYYENGENF